MTTDTTRETDVVVTLPGKRAGRRKRHWREITLYDGRRIPVCEHRYPNTPSSPPAT